MDIPKKSEIQERIAKQLIREVERLTERLSNKNPCNDCKVDRQIGNPNRWECECDRCDKPNDWKNECVKKLAEYEIAEEEGRWWCFRVKSDKLFTKLLGNLEGFGLERFLLCLKQEEILEKQFF